MSERDPLASDEAEESTSSGLISGDLTRLDDTQLTGIQMIHVPPLSPTKRMFEQLANVEDKNKYLYDFYKENFGKIEAHIALREELKTLIERHIPNVNVTKDYTPNIMVTMIDFYIQELKARFKKYQLEIGDLDTCSKCSRLKMFKSTETSQKIQQHKKNIFELIDKYETDLAELKAENLQLKDNRNHLEAQIDYLQTRIFHLERGTKYQGQFEDTMMEAIVDKEKLMAEFEGRHAAAERLNSTLKQDLDEAKLIINSMENELESTRRTLTEVEEKNMEELANVSQKIEINSIIEEAIASMLIKGGSETEPNMEECEKVVQEWTRLMREAIAEAEKNLDDVLEESTRVSNSLVEKENELKQLRERHEELNHEMNVFNENYEIKLKNVREIAERIENSTRQIQKAIQYNDDLRRFYENRKQQFHANLLGEQDTSWSPRSAERSNAFSRSPGTLHGITQSYASDHEIPREYQQKTKIESSTPGPETLRMVDGAINLNQTSTLSPKTPWISSTRFGYTDPKARIFNLPPGFSYERESIQKSIIFSSPEREKPLQVDINVEPHVLTETESGEHFVCDVTLNMKELPLYRGPTPRRFKRYVPHWYRTPPITSSAERKPHGVFTPKGVFEKGNIAVRNLFGSDFESPESPWETGRKCHFDLDYNAPPPGMFEDSFSPEMDRSMEWEVPSQMDRTLKKPQLDKTFTPPSELNRTFTAPSQLNRTFTPLPQLNRTFTPKRDATLSSELDETLALQLGTKASPQLNKTFSPPRIKPLSPRFDETPFPLMDRTFAPPPRSMQESPQMRRTYGFTRSKSPQLCSTFMSPRRELQSLQRSPQASSPARGVLPTGIQSWMHSRVDPKMFSRILPREHTSAQGRSMRPEYNDQDWMSQRHGREMFSQSPTSLRPSERLFLQQYDEDWFNRHHDAEMIHLESLDDYAHSDWMSHCQRF